MSRLENFGNLLAGGGPDTESAGESEARACLSDSEVTVLTVTSARLFKSPLAVTQTRHAGGLCQWCQGQAAGGRQAAQIARDSELRLLSSMKMPRNLPCEAWQHSGRWHLGWNRPQRAGPRPGIGPPARNTPAAASFQDHDQVQVLVHELVTVGY